ncbi:MAG: hypothetical protein ACKVUS_09225 [Saprospiraceae bacterium]
MNLLFRFLVAAAIVFVPVFVSACDICGCAGGGNSLGLLPLVQRHFVGFRWQSQVFRTIAHGSEPNSSETFRTLDFWGRWHPNRRVQLIANLPYQYTERHFDDGTSLHANGMGDAALLIQIALLDPKKQSFRDWGHTLQIGGGIKFPTGKNKLTDTESNVLTPALQPGTGSTDYLISGLYALRRGDWGASLDATARLMGKSNLGNQAGNRANIGMRGFWTKNVGKTAFLPFAGILLDARDADRENGKWQSDTGGWAAFGMVGAEVFRGDLSFGLGWQIPIASNFSNGKVSPKTRFNASVALLFGGKDKAFSVKTS